MRVCRAGPKQVHHFRTKGLKVFKILHLDKMAPGRLYAGGEVEDVAYTEDEDIITKQKITEHLRILYESLGVSKLFQELPDNFKSFDIGHHLGLTLEQVVPTALALVTAERSVGPPPSSTT